MVVIPGRCLYTLYFILWSLSRDGASWSDTGRMERCCARDLDVALAIHALHRNAGAPWDGSYKGDGAP